MLSQNIDVLVVGAGPAGSRAARDFAMRGLDVVLVEEHQSVGEPCHCSGLVTPRTLEVAQAGPGLVLNRIRGATFHSSEGATLQLTSPGEAAVVIDRAELDRRLVRQAVEAGAELRLRTKFVRFALDGRAESDNGRVRVTLDRSGERVELSAKLLIGADGALSRVAQQLSGGARRSRLVRALGGEAEYRGNHLTDHVQVFLDGRSAPGWFGWTIPLSQGRARVGTGTSNGVRPSDSLSMLQQSFPGYFAGTKLISRRAGNIPVWEPTGMVADRLMLVGDAARQVKPASGGGIFTGLISAGLAAEEGAKALAERDLSASRLSRYARSWDDKVGREFRRQHDMRRSLSRLERGGVQSLLSALDSDRLKGTVEAAGDIDFPSRLVWRLLAKRPSLLFDAAVVPRFPLAWLDPRITKKS